MQKCISFQRETVMELNDYCIFEIFKQIKLNCDKNCNHTNSVLRYKDIISFVSSNSKFNDIYLEWNGIKNNDFIMWTGKQVHIYFHRLYETLKQLKSSEKEQYLSIFKMAIEENNAVEVCLLDYNPKSYYPEHIDIFEMTTRLLQEKTSLKALLIRLTGYTPENLENFRHLRTLKLDVDIEVSYLMEIIKANPNLRNLEFIHPGRNGKISDVAVYCQKLESLTIEMNPSVDAGDYIPFAKLPYLNKWNIRGNPMKGSSHKLFKSLSHSTTLKDLNLSQMVLNVEEIKELSNLRSLKELHIRLQGSNIAQNSNIKSDLSLVTLSILDLPWEQEWKLEEQYNENIIRMDNIYIHNVMNELYINSPSKDIKDVILKAQANKNTFNIMQEMCNALNDPMDLNKIASFFVLKSLFSLVQEYAESINLFANLKDLQGLEIQIQINIRNELRELQETNPLVDLIDIEQSIPLDPASKGLILMYQLQGLQKILNFSVLTNVSNEKAIKNCEIHFFLSFQFTRF